MTKTCQRIHSIKHNVTVALEITDTFSSPVALQITSQGIFHTGESVLCSALSGDIISAKSLSTNLLTNQKAL